MTKRTKKVGSAGRFGPRYGRRIRKMVSDIEAVQKLRHVCPECKKHAVYRIASGIWACRICNVKFTGGAYTPVTSRAAQLKHVEKPKIETKPEKEKKPAKPKKERKKREKKAAEAPAE